VPLRSGGPAPYAPPAAVLTFINAYRDKSLPAAFTPDVYVRAGVQESLVPRVAATLEGLELIDQNGRPTAELEGLRRATADEYKQRLAAVVRAVYAEVFQFVDPARDTPERIADQFRVFEPIGQRARMVTLFLGLCVEAGIITESTKRPTNTAASSRPNGPRRQSEPTKRATLVSVPRARLRRDDDDSVPPALRGLLESLPFPPETGWTRTQRDGFVAAFGSVLDFCIPIIEPPREISYESPGRTAGQDDGTQ
jgi:hypothetical protein